MHAIIWPLPGDGEETQVRVFVTDEQAVDWASRNCPPGGWQYARVIGTMSDTQAMNQLLAEWDHHDEDDGWSGGDAVDFVGNLLRATGRIKLGRI